MTTPERWRRVEELYHAALTRAPGERVAFLAAACAGDDVLRQEIESLIAQPASAGGFLAGSIRDGAVAQLVREQTTMTMIGRRIGSYEIVSPLGAGGMGEVYRARDTKLGRDVAIKLLPRAFTSDPERLARFEREARMLAALNHPNIGAIYGVEEIDGTRALVLELVEGDTLADLLAKGARPGPSMLAVARQIADALEAAHDKGIVHRDLKPANVKITPAGVVKVLDFGLARAGGAGAAGGDALSESPTVTIGGTREGMILGTAAYMSPEQARGQAVDKRTDIWAFGCVLYEMLAGRVAFAGQTISDTIAAILEREPDWKALPDKTPASVYRLLQRCLEKDPQRRLHDIADARIEIDDSLAVPAITGDAVPAVRRRRGNRLAWILMVVTTAASIAFAALYLRGAPPADVRLMRFSVGPPPDVALSTGARENVAMLSPDGRRLVFVATGAGSGPSLWVRALDALEAKRLPATEGATRPFWSPDSRTLGFFADNKLRTVDAVGGPVQSLTDASTVALGGAWNRDGLILFSYRGTGIFKIPSSGGQPTPATTLDASRGETGHRYPAFLPDGRHFLYVATPSNAVWLGSLDSKETTRLLTADSQAQYAPPGYLLFERQGTLLAQPFDARDATLTGAAVPIAEQLASDGFGYAKFSVSDNGVLAYRTGGPGSLTQLSWVDRSGKPLGVVGEPGRYRNPELSPDGTRVVMEGTDPNLRTQDVWLLDLARGAVSRFTFDPANDSYPVWSPDGHSIMFGSDRRGISNLYQKQANGVGSEALVLESAADMVPWSWAHDERFVVYRTPMNTAMNLVNNLGILPFVGERTTRLYEPSRFQQVQAQLSPDDRWIAYSSSESGRYEIYVKSFPAPGGGKWQISREGGLQPRWRRDGRELIYYASDGRLMAVPVTNGAALEVGAPVPLFEAHVLNGPTAAFGFRHQYDVTPDGQRFLLNVPVEETASSPINLVVNWTAALRK